MTTPSASFFNACHLANGLKHNFKLCFKWNIFYFYKHFGIDLAKEALNELICNKHAQKMQEKQNCSLGCTVKWQKYTKRKLEKGAK